VQAPGAWQWSHPTQVHCGVGALAAYALPEACTSIVVVTTKGHVARGTLEHIRGLIGNRELHVWDDVESNPSVTSLAAGAAALAPYRNSAMIALGGGSAIDTAKVLAALLAQPSASLQDLLGTEVVRSQPRPLIAIPTTSGTGSEVTPFATVWDKTAKRKLSVAGPALFPDVALVDASLTLDLPADVTYATGLDALSQACESVWSRRATPMTLGVAIEAAQHSLVALEALASGNSDIAVRERMATGSLLAGLAISHSRTSLAHSISYPVTAHFGVPHGIACSFTLPAILRAWASKDDGRLQRLAVALGERGPMGLAERVERLLRRCGVPSVLAQAGVTVQALRALADEMITPGRGDNTFVACSTEDAVGTAVAGLGLT
jgi:alcohol dehydrogenase